MVNLIGMKYVIAISSTLLRYVLRIRMQKSLIQVPETGTYQWQLFDYWSDDYRTTRAEHSAYIALNFAGVLDACKNKFMQLMKYHQQQAVSASNPVVHQKAIQRLQSTMTGAALAFESAVK